jgi:hypothetical protein
VAPAERSEEAEDLLDDLLVVLFGLPADAWCAIAAAVPDELSERIALTLYSREIARYFRAAAR